MYCRTWNVRDMKSSRIWSIGNSRAWKFCEFLDCRLQELSNGGFGLKIGPFLRKLHPFLSLFSEMSIDWLFMCMKSSRIRGIREHFMHANISCSAVPVLDSGDVRHGMKPLLPYHLGVELICSPTFPPYESALHAICEFQATGVSFVFCCILLINCEVSSCVFLMASL